MRKQILSAQIAVKTGCDLQFVATNFNIQTQPQTN
jgi:hypothetical protein